MKLFYLLLIVGLSLPLLADSPPSYLGNTKATVLTSLTSRGNLTLSSGTPENCVRTEATGLIVYRCDVKGAEGFYQDEKGSLSVAFSKLIVMYKSHHSELYREFHFEGGWKEKGPVELNSIASLVIVQNAKTPLSVNGTFELSSYHLAFPLQGIVITE